MIQSDPCPGCAYNPDKARIPSERIRLEKTICTQCREERIASGELPNPKEKKKQQRNKYGVDISPEGKDRRTVDGILFDSLKEAKRYQELKQLEAAGEISKLRLQVRFPFELNGIYLGCYRADFLYLSSEQPGTVVEDSKGKKTPMYNRNKKMVRAFYGIEIKET